LSQDEREICWKPHPNVVINSFKAFAAKRFSTKKHIFCLARFKQVAYLIPSWSKPYIFSFDNLKLPLASFKSDLKGKKTKKTCANLLSIIDYINIHLDFLTKILVKINSSFIPFFFGAMFKHKASFSLFGSHRLINTLPSSSSVLSSFSC